MESTTENVVAIVKEALEAKGWHVDWDGGDSIRIYDSGASPSGWVRCYPAESDPELADVVRVMTHREKVGYIGEVVALPTGVSPRYRILTPDGEEHPVPRSAIRPATERESDDYIDRCNRYDAVRKRGVN